MNSATKNILIGPLRLAQSRLITLNVGLGAIFASSSVDCGLNLVLQVLTNWRLYVSNDTSIAALVVFVGGSSRVLLNCQQGECPLHMSSTWNWPPSVLG